MQKLENLSTKSVDFDFEKIWGGILDFWRLVWRRTEWLSDAPWASKTLWRPYRMALGRPLGLFLGKNKAFSASFSRTTELTVGFANAICSAGL